MEIDIDVRNPTSSQCRAARIILGWSLIEASRRTGLSIAAISRSESVQDNHQSAKARRNVVKAYEAAGVSILQDGEGRGVFWSRSDRQDLR